ncbi:cytochrome P450 oxidoreductase OrdA-like protein [Desarmillaria ectypa]|nr:cytochrome P450 oxidoreductase OrdA-like protein [Desarmillaria ectypa]
MDITIGTFVGVLALLYVLTKLYSIFQTKPSLPPGPPRKPIIGNLFDLPKPGEYEYKHWAKHHEAYGPISSLSIMGQHIIILNDMQTAIDLLEKRSSIYSDRFSSIFGGIMCGWRASLAMSPNGHRFRAIRKTLHQTIGTKSSLQQFTSLQTTEIRRLLTKILKSPDQLEYYIRKATGAIILSISHGYSINRDAPDAFVTLADECMAEASIAFQPGVWMVDVIPFLRYLPDWFPGTEFKQVAKKYLDRCTEFVERPYAFVKQQMERGVSRPSYTETMLKLHGKSLTSEQEDLIKWGAAALYGAGSDTTVSVTYSFVLLMILYPHVQAKAQEELDRVVGEDRLPSYEDRDNLPYINALIHEALRFNPVLPMCVPHVPSQDDIYQGYLIPKGAVIMPNLHHMARDPATYHSPDVFEPQRFLGWDGRDPEPDIDIAFGFGRRICPGNVLADQTLFLAFAMILSVFDIKADDNSSVELKDDWTAGLISRPKPFPCKIEPRSGKALALIMSFEEEPASKQKSDADALGTVSW